VWHAGRRLTGRVAVLRPMLRAVKTGLFHPAVDDIVDSAQERPNLKLKLSLIAMGAFGAAFQGPSDSSVVFDAASIKSVVMPQDGSTNRVGGRLAFLQMQSHEGGPGTMDPTRIHYIQLLQTMIAEAFEVPFEQIRGPEWMTETLFEIDAVVPPDTAVHDAHLMLRNLLVERFQMKYQIGAKPVNGYALLLEKNGPVISPAKGARAPSTVAILYDAKGLSMPQLIGKPGIHRTVDNRGWTVAFEQQTMRQLTAYLAEQYAAPVVDMTGMTGEYDFTLEFYPPRWGPRTGESTGVKYFPQLSSVVRSKLGIKLDHKKQPGPLVLINQIEQTPIEN
jgi:uncharacterized protein (TIGR03435 family)